MFSVCLAMPVTTPMKTLTQMEAPKKGSLASESTIRGPMDRRIDLTRRYKNTKASIQVVNHSIANSPVTENPISKTTSHQGATFRKLVQAERMPRALTKELRPQIADALCVIIELP